MTFKNKIIRMQFYTIVPEQWVFIMERWGNFSKILQPGFHLLTPIMDRIAYKHTLKEYAMEVNE